MAGMFYSLQEVAEKLSITEDKIKELVREGRLREFRDGDNLLFKVDEVQALLSDSAVMAAKEAAEPEADEDEIIPGGDTTATELSIEDEFTNADTTIADEGISALDEGGADTGSAIIDEDISVLDEDSGTGSAIPDEGISVLDEAETGSKISEEGLGVLDNADTEADTAITDSGINVLGETDSEYLLSDDTKGETKTEIGSGEASLEEIEGDVNLDSFGTGSGLLDLSLQADDTSLGGILDEIYTPGEEGQKESDEAVAALDEPVDTEQMLTAVGIEAQPSEMAAPMISSYAEPKPDAVSNAFGIVLFIPLLAVIYTAIVAIAGMNGLMPGALKPIQSIVWYVMGGLAAVSLVVIAAPLVLKPGGAKAAKKPKAKKEKKPKPPKVKKEKKKKKKK